VNLASAFTKILDNFGIAHKVSLLEHLHGKMRITSGTRFSVLHAIMHHPTTQ